MFISPELPMQQGSSVLFAQFPHEFWELLDSNSEIAVLLRICKNIGFAKNGVCFESRESMCRACHISKNTWKAVIESLQEKKIIVVDEGYNRPHRITLHENVAGVKIRTRNRYNIYRGSNLTSAKKGGESDYHTLHDADREPFKVAQRMLEEFQDARNGVQSSRAQQAEGVCEPDEQRLGDENVSNAADTRNTGSGTEE